MVMMIVQFQLVFHLFYFEFQIWFSLVFFISINSQFGSNPSMNVYCHFNRLSLRSSRNVQNKSIYFLLFQFPEENFMLVLSFNL